MKTRWHTFIRLRQTKKYAKYGREYYTLLSTARHILLANYWESWWIDKDTDTSSKNHAWVDVHV
jgi:hypothetical protein